MERNISQRTSKTNCAVRLNFRVSLGLLRRYYEKQFVQKIIFKTLKARFIFITRFYGCTVVVYNQT